MKKYLMMGAAALTMGFAFVSCSSDDEIYNPNADALTDNYQSSFEKNVGKPAAGHTWGFNQTRATRANAVVTGDPFTFEETDGYYVVDENDDRLEGALTYEEAVEAAYEPSWYGTNWNKFNEQTTKLLLPNGEYSLHFHENKAKHTLFVTGDNVTLNVTSSKSIDNAKIYLLSGTTLNLNMDKYINDLEIYVAGNATLNYNAEKLYKQTGGGKIYNRGTVNLQENFEANQNAVVYNEGTVIGTNITSKPGVGNKSFFYNFGNIELSGDMELNSCANFYNEGTVTVAKETNVTQKNIYWINKGHYTTGSMVFSAKNATFYNFCQLLVLGNAHMYDGEFNLMNDSYTEAATADYDNFIVNMHDGAGFNVKGNTDWAAQGDGTFQGFRTVNDGDNAYVRLAGTTTVAGHLHSLEITEGITYAINNIVDKGAGNSGVQPTYVLAGNAADFSKVTMAPKANDCGFTWNEEGDDDEEYVKESGRIFCEDLGTIGDFDFNDVVFDAKVYYWKKKGTASHTEITLLAAGGTMKITVAGVDVHKAFGQPDSKMINTGDDSKCVKGLDPVLFKAETAYASLYDIPIVVKHGAAERVLEAKPGKAPQKYVAPIGTKWADEYVNVTKVYPKFKEWVEKESVTPEWANANAVLTNQALADNAAELAK